MLWTSPTCTGVTTHQRAHADAREHDQQSEILANGIDSRELGAQFLCISITTLKPRNQDEVMHHQAFQHAVLIAQTKLPSKCMIRYRNMQKNCPCECSFDSAQSFSLARYNIRLHLPCEPQKMQPIPMSSTAHDPHFLCHLL